MDGKITHDTTFTKKEKSMFKWITTLVLVLVGCGSSIGLAKTTFMEENDLYKEDTMFLSNMQENEFYDILNEVQGQFGWISQQTGMRLEITGEWDNSEVNAYANVEGNVRKVVIYGGLARRPEITYDGLSLVVCHEVAHHLAGFPFYQGAWASNEGNSDYFSTLACGRLLWNGKAAENAEFAAIVPPYPKSLCDKVWSGEGDRNLCYRSMVAGKSLGNLLARLGGGTVNYETPDRRIVAKTSDSHPQAQCRLDTYMQGSLCTGTWRHGAIPRTEQQAFASSCPSNRWFGYRPKCWFKASVGVKKPKAD